MTKEYEILTDMYNRLDALPNIRYVGYYPDNHINVVSTNLPAVLIYTGNSTSLFNSGRRNNNRLNVHIMFYTDFNVSRLQEILDIQDSIISALIANIQYDGKVANIWGYTILVGDITDFITPSTVGMNSNMTVRKITLDVLYYTCGIS